MSCPAAKKRLDLRHHSNVCGQRGRRNHRLEFIVHRQVINGDTVMNERTDRIVLNGKPIELPVMGVFEFRDGKIARWWDYFDMGPFTG